VTHVSPATPSQTTTIAQVLEEVADLSAGAVTVFLPLLILAVPGIALVVVPVIAAGAVIAVAGALLALPLAAPYLVLRAIRGRRVAHGRRPGSRERQRVALRVQARPTQTH
jgi:hypothetical protein